jgi:signal transduction histidine kinase
VSGQGEYTSACLVYKPRVPRSVIRSYLLVNLHEQTPWERDFSPCFELAPNVARLAHHAFTELLSNAVDHSGNTNISISMRQNPKHLHLLIRDDGCGVFALAHSKVQLQTRNRNARVTAMVAQAR